MITKDQLLRVLISLHRRRIFREKSFSSHDFIQEYCRRYETEYLDWLMDYQGTGHAFHTVHKQIGRFVSTHEGKEVLRGITYHRTNRDDSECVHGTIDKPMWWRFTDLS